MVGLIVLPEDVVESLVTALGFHVRGIFDILERSNGACPIDNMDTVYNTPVPGLPRRASATILNCVWWSVMAIRDSRRMRLPLGLWTCVKKCLGRRR